MAQPLRAFLSTGPGLKPIMSVKMHLDDPVRATYIPGPIVHHHAAQDSAASSLLTQSTDTCATRIRAPDHPHDNRRVYAGGGLGSLQSRIRQRSCGAFPFLRCTKQHAAGSPHDGVAATVESRGQRLAPPPSIVSQYWQQFLSRSRMFFLDSARVWCGILLYSSSRITLGIATRIRAACNI